jgi:hypothetical protein
MRMGCSRRHRETGMAARPWSWGTGDSGLVLLLSCVGYMHRFSLVFLLCEFCLCGMGLPEWTRSWINSAHSFQSANFLPGLSGFLC